MTAESLMTKREVADLFRVHPRSVMRWAARGRLTPLRPGGGTNAGVYFRREDVERLARPQGGGSVDDDRKTA